MNPIVGKTRTTNDTGIVSIFWHAVRVVGCFSKFAGVRKKKKLCCFQNLVQLALTRVYVRLSPFWKVLPKFRLWLLDRTYGNIDITHHTTCCLTVQALTQFCTPPTSQQVCGLIALDWIVIYRRSGWDSNTNTHL